MEHSANKWFLSRNSHQPRFQREWIVRYAVKFPEAGAMKQLLLFIKSKYLENSWKSNAQYNIYLQKLDYNLAGALEEADSKP